MFYNENEETAMVSALKDNIHKINKLADMYGPEGGIGPASTTQVTVRMDQDRVVTAHAKVTVHLMSVVDSNIPAEKVWAKK